MGRGEYGSHSLDFRASRARAQERAGIVNFQTIVGDFVGSIIGIRKGPW